MGESDGEEIEKMEPVNDDLSQEDIKNVDLAGIDMEAVKNIVSEKKQETKEVHIAEVIETINQNPELQESLKNSVTVSTEDLAPFILAAKEYYEDTNDDDSLDELLNLIE